VQASGRVGEEGGVDGVGEEEREGGLLPLRVVQHGGGVAGEQLAERGERRRRGGGGGGGEERHAECSDGESVKSREVFSNLVKRSIEHSQSVNQAQSWWHGDRLQQAVSLTAAEGIGGLTHAHRHVGAENNICVEYVVG
jgi:hypothetical protein